MGKMRIFEKKNYQP